MNPFEKKITIIIVAFILLSGCFNESNEPFNNPADCISGYTDESLDIVTWNLHDFPAKGEITIDSLASLIVRLDADILALQEITNVPDFNKLLSKLPGYRGYINGGSYLNLAYLVKSRVPVGPNSLRVLFEEDPYFFPRPPFCITLTAAGLPEIVFIDVHLKCCGGAENRYRRATALGYLKKYLDDSLKDSKVIVLGDFNEEIDSPESENLFAGFLNDSLNYRFADRSIASGNNSDWSFPGWPSQIDHFIITDELFDNFISVKCITPDRCDSLYLINVSDHRPVLMKINQKK